MDFPQNMSMEEAFALAEAEAKLNAALAEAHKRGLRFDGWDEHFNYEEWMKNWKKEGC